MTIKELEIQLALGTLVLYIVSWSDGCHDSTDVVGVFSSKEKAEKYIHSSKTPTAEYHTVHKCVIDDPNEFIEEYFIAR